MKHYTNSLIAMLGDEYRPCSRRDNAVSGVVGRRANHVLASSHWSLRCCCVSGSHNTTWK